MAREKENMKTYNLTFTANETKELIIEHKFFLILSDEGFPVDISIRSGGGFSKMEGLQAGFNLTFPDGEIGRSVLINSASAQTVKLYMGSAKAEYARLSGVVSLAGTPNVNIANIPMVNMLEVGRTINFSRDVEHTTQVNANTFTPIITPAENNTGMMIEKIKGLYYNGGGDTGKQKIIMHNTTPTALGQGIVIDRSIWISTASASTMSIKNEKKIFIPANFGVFMHTTQALDINYSFTSIYGFKL